MTTRKKPKFRVGDKVLVKGEVVERHPDGGFYVKIGCATLYFDEPELRPLNAREEGKK